MNLKMYPLRVLKLFCTDPKTASRKTSLLALALFSFMSIYGQFESSYTVLDSMYIFNYGYEQDSTCISRVMYEFNEYGLKSVSTDYGYDNDISAWLPVTRKTYSYNLFGLTDTILETRRDKESGEWSDYSRIIDEYDVMGRDTAHATYRWYESYNWMGETKSRWKYDTYGNLIYDETMNWDMMNNVWIGQNLITWEKDENGLELGRTDYMVSVGDSYWFAHTWTEHKFDEQGLDTLTTTYSWDAINEEWDAYDKSVRSYNANGKEEEHLMYYWDPEEDFWVLQSKYTYTYDVSSDTICEVYDLLRDGVWIPFWRNYLIKQNGTYLYYERSTWNVDTEKYERNFKTIRNFNEFGSLTLDEDYSYDLNSDSWVGGIKGVYCYNSEGDQLEHSVYYWDASLSNWKLTYRHYYYYTEMEDISAPQISVLTDTVAKYINIDFISSQDARVFLVSAGTLPDSDLEDVSLGMTDVFSLETGSISTSSVADSGIHMLYAVNTGGLVSLASRVWITLQQTVVHMTEERSVRIYPTLVNHSFTIESEQPVETIELYDLYGRLVKVIEGEQQAVVIDISDLKPGIYCVIPDHRKDFSVMITKL